MPPRRYSRYSFCNTVADSDGKLFMTERVPFRYRPLQDTTQYTAQEGDTLYALAAREYAGIPRPAGLWWVIADFQPEPIFDPTIRLAAGQVIYIPSLRTVQELVFDRKRKDEADL
jgi:nucleoid-associated protein YgaU